MQDRPAHGQGECLPRVVTSQFHYSRRGESSPAYTARMRSRAKRRYLLESGSFVFLAAIWAASAVAQAAASPQAEFPTEPGPYLAPQRLVRVGEGRTINLICLGSGSPTVLLTAGLGSWSVVWRWVQPTLARSTRVCAWDPAGFGFSSPSSE